MQQALELIEILLFIEQLVIIWLLESSALIISLSNAYGQPNWMCYRPDRFSQLSSTYLVCSSAYTEGVASVV